jgi:allantoate deiminase/N-carbamoyl-L-amino-acid hydrolase
MAQVSELSGSQTASDGALGRRIVALADHLASWSETANGLTCTYLSTAHLAVAEELAALMKKAGLGVEIDTVENVTGRHESATPGAKTLIVGSHYDTVRNAGKYDGRLGILTALVVAEHLTRNGITLPFNLEIIAFAEEEGVRFPASYIGSRAVAGRFEDKQLESRDAKGITLAQALLEVGADPKTIPLLARDPATLAGYLEVHIEQGPVLLEANLPVGIVTAIAGGSRYLVSIDGEAGHAGTVPMALRHDAIAAAAEMTLFVESRCNRPGLVGTVGRFTVAGGATNIIAGHCEISLDIRSGDDATRLAAVVDILAEIQRIAKRRGVKATTTQALDAPAVPCSPRLQDAFAASIARIGVPVRRLPSGAGHDAVMFSGVTDVGMLFVRCGNGGVSHSPRETVSAEDAEIAARVLLDVLLNLKAA